MCDSIRLAAVLSHLRFAGADASLLPGIALTSRPAEPTTPEAAPSLTTTAAPNVRARASSYATRLVLLGTASGPLISPDRTGIASAVIVDDAVYLVDCGHGATRQLKSFEVSTQADRSIFEALRGVFFTHLHSDHVIDYPGLLLFGWFEGLNRVKKPVQVYGPGRRGKVEPIFGSPDQPVPLIAPGNPTPGTVDMTSSLLAAFATDLNDRMRVNHLPDLRTLFQIQDISIPIVSDPDVDPAPLMEPFLVMQDEHVKVTATLVFHAPVFPAFAFRFDTPDGAIVFSGDTAPSPNLIKLAQGADILVHEAIDVQWVQSLFPAPYTSQEEAIIHHLLSGHTSIEDTGRIASAARVKTLVLSHLTPTGPQGPHWHDASTYFAGQLVVGEDLLQMGVGNKNKRKEV